MLHPWISGQLVNLRNADLKRAVSSRRPAQNDNPQDPPGFMSVWAGRALISIGWRIGGTASLPATVRRRLAWSRSSPSMDPPPTTRLC